MGYVSSPALPAGKYTLVGRQDNGLPEAVVVARTEEERDMFLVLCELPARAVPVQEMWKETTEKQLDIAMPLVVEYIKENWGDSAISAEEEQQLLAGNIPHKWSRVAEEQVMNLIRGELFVPQYELDNTKSGVLMLVDATCQKALLAGVTWKNIYAYTGGDYDIWRDVVRTCAAGVPIEDIFTPGLA